MFNWLFPIVIIFTILIISIPFVISICQNRIDIFEPIIFKMVFSAMIVIVMIDQVYPQKESLRFEGELAFPFEQAMLITATSFLIFFFFMVASYYLRFDAYSKLEFPRLSDNKIIAETLRTVGLLYMVMGFFFYGVLIYDSIPLENLLILYDSEIARSEFFSGGLTRVYRELSYLSYIGYFLWLGSITAKQKYIRLWQIFPVPVFMVMYGILANRGRVIMILLIFVVIIYNLYRNQLGAIYTKVTIDKNGGSNMVLSIILVLIGFLSAIFIQVGRNLRRGMGLGQSISELDPTSFLTFGIQDGFVDWFPVIVDLVPEEIGYYFGTRYAMVILGYIPRVIWEDKPPLTMGGIARRAMLPDASGGRTVGEIGTYYAHFGMFGLVFFGIISGIVLRTLYELLLRNKNSSLIVVVYAIVLSIIVPGGLTNNYLQMLVTHLAPTFVVIIVIHYRCFR